MSRQAPESNKRGFGWAVAFSVLSFGVAFAALQAQTGTVKKFCESIPVGWTIAQVRDAAQAQGLEVRMDPFTQMRVLPAFWDPARRSCRVFFNRNQTVEYRSWQGS